MNTTHIDPDRPEATEISLDFTWSGMLPVLIAGLVDGTAAGKVMARQHLARMAAVADLAVHAASVLQQISTDGVELPPDALEAIKRWRSVAQSAGSNDPPGLSTTHAERDEFSIGYCVNGFYIGTCDAGGECRRKSVETWRSRDAAKRALDRGEWTPNQ